VAPCRPRGGCGGKKNTPALVGTLTTAPPSRVSSSSLWSGMYRSTSASTKSAGMNLRGTHGAAASLQCISGDAMTRAVTVHALSLCTRCHCARAVLSLCTRCHCARAVTVHAPPPCVHAL
jgi:hypothetical protein